MKKLAITFLLFTSFASAQSRAIWNFYSQFPWGPPTNIFTGSMQTETLYVNEIDLAQGDSITLGQATFNALAKNASTSMLVCFYRDLLTAPAAQNLVAISQTGPITVSAINNLFSGTFYFAYVQTGGPALATESFTEGVYPQMSALWNHNLVRWGVSANYVAGGGCPASLGPLTAVKTTSNFPVFLLEAVPSK